MAQTKKGVFVVLMLIMAVLVAACGENKGKPGETGGADPEKETNKKIRIGIAMKTEVQPRWKFDLQYMQEKAQELGAELIVQWANDDVSKQANQVENLLSQGIDALVIVPVSDKTGPVVDKAKSAGVPVIAYDAMIQNSDIDLYVTRNNYKVGELQAQAALKYTGGKGNFVLLKGDPATTVAQGIAQAYEKILKTNADIHIVAEQWHQNWSTEKALKTAEDALSAQNDNIQAFVSSNDGMAMGITQAVKGRDLDGKVFISGLDVEVGSARLIAEGIQTMSVWTKLDEGAKRTIEAAVALAKGEAPQADEVTNNGKKDVPTLAVDVVEVNKDNLCTFINEMAPTGWMTEEEVFVNVPNACK
ncbi:substrate-binding domain-containing protein [Cohnella boryungensis]|uniref:Substrate-binding domain-containing protein n=1 Tax=Cohnella boryungensis TaxID=768479 RepID=A0ABV8SFF5_9BACL